MCFDCRQYNVMFRASNVLRPEVVKQMLKFTKKIKNVTFAGKTWQDICLRVPIVATPACFDYKQEKTEDCEDYKMPNLTASDITLMIPLVKRVEKEGFSPKLGMCLDHLIS